MNCSVAEDGVELGVEVEALAVADAGVEAEAARGFDLRCAGVNSEYAASGRDESRGEYAVAASEVEDSLARGVRGPARRGRRRSGRCARRYRGPSFVVYSLSRRPFFEGNYLTIVNSIQDATVFATNLTKVS